MPANLENSAVVTGLGKVSFHSNPKERQCQRRFKLLHNCTRLTHKQSNAQNSPSQASTLKKNKIMASGPITSWQIDGKTMDTVTDFNFLDSKITPDGDCSHEFKRCLLLERKAMTNLNNILKSRDITLPTKFHIVTAIVFFNSFSTCHVWM